VPKKKILVNLGASKKRIWEMGGLSNICHPQRSSNVTSKQKKKGGPEKKIDRVCKT